MACIKSASRSALVAFAPDAPYMAAGTLAGAVDLSFSSTANLEIFKLDFVSEGPDLPVVGTSPSSERFNRLSWSKAESYTKEYSLGLVAGGLADGSIGVWNPQKLISSNDVDGAYVARLDKHTGPVRGLEFSPHSSNLLASGADEGELCIWNMENPQEPNRFPPLKSSGSPGEISYLSWNPKFQHILASTSYTGMTVVWDLKKQKPVTSFQDPMKRRCSVLQWNPDNSTHLMVASDDDSSPSLKLWDVRKTISPVREFVGHTQGVIAMSWCPNDSALLLTCSKDFRTVCWDTVKGEIIYELPASTNWNFDVHWYPKIPGVISASSFDGKIGIYNIEACSRTVGSSGAANLKAPKWLKRPVGVSFGFGGKIVSFRPSSSATGAPSASSEVHIHNLVTEHNLVSRSTEFESAIHSGEKSSLRDLCERKSQECEARDDKEAWAFLKVMFGDEGSARTNLLSHLGFAVTNTEDMNGSDELGAEFSSGLTLEDKTHTEANPADQSGFDIDNGEDFFNNDQPSVADSPKVSDIANGAEPELQSTEEVSDPSLDESIQHALVVGDYKGAVSKCISANRMADALVISHLGGTDLWKATRDQYLKRTNLPYLKVVSALVSNDLMVLVNTRPLSSWKETLALLCTFAQQEEWTMLCDTLASRLKNAGDMLAATLCYICAGNIDKTVEIWSHNLKYETEGISYTDRLQDLMEKTVVLTLATGQKQFSVPISKLVENYAELLASQGQLTTAMEYLKLLGSAESSNELAILHNRILQCAQEMDIPAAKHTEHATATSEPMYNTQQSSLEQSTAQISYNQQQIPQPHQGYHQSPYPSGYQQHQVPSGAGSSYTAFPTHQQQQQQQVVSGTSYPSGYQQPMGPYGGYQPAPTQQKKQFQEYINPVPFQPSSSPQMFLPSHETNASQMQPTAPPAMPQPAVNSFVPATPPTLKNADQYQQPSLASQLYPGSITSSYQPTQPAPGSLSSGFPTSATVPGIKYPSPVTPTATPMGFPQMTNPGFVQNTMLGTTQPTNFVEPVQTTSAPAAPPPTVQTADTSNVAAELKPVVATLKRLYNETADFLGGPQANIAKRREIEDNSRRIGSLLAKLNSQDISPNVASKLIQLCTALDSGDYASALHIQVMLTGSDWDECNQWLAALKRMIKTRQNMRL